jgi:hypothetical protein
VGISHRCDVRGWDTVGRPRDDTEAAERIVHIALTSKSDALLG